MLANNQPRRAGAKNRTRRSKEQRAFFIAFGQYRQLRETLSVTTDMTEKNRIYRRMVNLLDVMQFLNTNSGLPS